MKFGLDQWNKKMPALAKWLAAVCLAFSTGVTTYGYFVENSPTLMKIGGGCFIASCVLPKLFGTIDEENVNEHQKPLEN